MKAQELLFQLQDKGYRDFQSKLIPTIPVETIIGVRIPAIRKLAKEYGKDPEDNWAVCDIFSPKVFRKNKGKLIDKIREWTTSGHPYTCRFGMEMLMTHFLDEDFQVEYLEIPAAVHSEEYYVNMMIAWFYATALAKQWDEAVGYIEKKCLDPWTHNKTIQKARESYRITREQKEYLKTLKV